jgi:hypothetical protein
MVCALALRDMATTTARTNAVMSDRMSNLHTHGPP